jgi:hypothetical protein
MRRESATRAHFVCKAGSRLLRFLLIEAAQKSLGKDGKLNRFYILYYDAYERGYFGPQKGTFTV